MNGPRIASERHTANSEMSPAQVRALKKTLADIYVRLDTIEDELAEPGAQAE